MATINDRGDSVPHELRTATEPREDLVEPVTIASIREVNPTIRLIQLRAKEPDHAIKVRFISRLHGPFRGLEFWQAST